ncbi:MAG: flagellar motor protein MotB [Gemmatimonadota bacterium]|nr:flagellar motor protein MotB [Gemmatimonadota bacterium]
MKTEREQIIRVVRKKRRAHGHHGGAWKVAFADFMTSMMALFLVLWLVTQSSEVRTAIAGYFQDPMGRAGEFGSSVIPGEGQPLLPGKPGVSIKMADGRRDRMIALSQRIKDVIPDSLDAMGLGSHVEVVITDEGLRISLLEDSTDVFFASGISRPLPRAEVIFRSIGSVLGTAGYALVVEGHTDALPYTGRADYDNWELSSDRANSVRRSLLAGGLGEAQVRAVRGLADRDPRTPEDPRAPQNRRVTILVRVPEEISIAAVPPAAPRNTAMIGGGTGRP